MILPKSQVNEMFAGQGILSPQVPAPAPPQIQQPNNFNGTMARVGNWLKNAPTDPRFNLGMGLLSAAYDGRINPAQAAMGGLNSAFDARNTAEQLRIRQQQQRQMGQRTGIMQQQQALREQQEARQQAEYERALEEYNRQKTVGGEIEGILSDQDALPGMDPAMRESIARLARIAPAAAAAQLSRWQQMQTQLQQQRSGGFNPVLDEFGGINFPARDPQTGLTFLNPAMDPQGNQMRAPLSQSEEELMQGYNQTAVQASNEAARMGGLAERFDSDLMTGAWQGYGGNFGEWAKRAVGGENEVSALRTEYEQFKNRSVINDLPPGVASDRDIAIAMRGWPTATADPEYVASYLRGMQKLRVVEWASAQHNQDYLGRTLNPKGMAADWQTNKTAAIEDAFKRHGLTLTPQDAANLGVSPNRYVPHDEAGILQ